MKRFLIGLLMLAVCFGAPAATTIQWFHQQPAVTALSNEMTAVFESGASNQYFSAPLSVLRQFTSGSTNGANAFFTNTVIQNLTNNYLFSTNLFATNVYENFVTNNYLFTTNLFATNVYENFTTNNYLFSTNLFATNVYENFTTNNYLFSTNLFATNTYVNFFTNDYAFITNLYTTNAYIEFLTNNYLFTTNLFNTNTYVLYFTNSWGWITNLQNVTMTNVILVSSNAYITNITANKLYVTNIYANGDAEFDHITVTNGITNLSLNANQFVGTDANKRLVSTLNGNTLTNSDGYTFVSMADTNWVLQQVAQFGAFEYFGGPTNSFAITNSTESVSRTNVFTCSVAPFVNASTSTISTLVLNAYARHAISTNKFDRIAAGPVSIETYPFRSGGGGTVSGHYEFYAVDCVSNIMYELGSGPSFTISATAPTLITTSFVITNGFTATNKCFACIAFKIDSAGSGGPSLHWAHGGVYAAHLNFVRPISSATINSTQITGTITNEIDTTSTVTATAYKVYTNSWAGATNSIDLTYGWVKYLAYTPCSVTGLTGKGSTGKKVQNTLLTITNAASTNITLYYTGTVRTGDGARSWTITNACEGVLSLEFDPNDSTNAVFRMFY